MPQLSRRDALLSLVGGASVGGLLLHEVVRRPPALPDEFDEHHVVTLHALADVIYPSAIEPSDEFFIAYLNTLGRDRRRATHRALADLDRLSRRETGRPFHRLPTRKRDARLRTLGVDRVHSRPDGTAAERIRYHLVGSLLYALFTSPTGSRLFGVRNPIGHPGGIDTYQEAERG